MNHSFGMAIEALVASLLVVTLGYCWLLNRRLKLLKADEHSLKATIGELITATEIAERAIGGLKMTVRDVNENLRTQIATASDLTDQLRRQIAEGDNVVRRISRIAVAARPVADAPAPVAPPAPSAARAVAAAAAAFTERRRTNGLAA